MLLLVCYLNKLQNARCNDKDDQINLKDGVIHKIDLLKSISCGLDKNKPT